MSRNLRRSWLPFGTVILALTISFQCAAATWHVDRSAPPNGDGASWSTAFQYLQDALHVNQQDGDLIKIADGTYFPDEDSANPYPNGVGVDNAISFTADNISLTIRGGYYGYNTLSIDPETNNPDLYPTILTGDLDEDDNPNVLGSYDDNMTIIFKANAAPDGITIEGLTLTAAYAQYSSQDPAMILTNASVTVSRCTFIDNHTKPSTSSGNQFRGGGLVLGTYDITKQSVFIVKNCTFTRNDGGRGSGGGLFVLGIGNSDIVATVTNCAFSGNRARLGGGLAFQNEGVETTSHVVNCTFSDNEAALAGGGAHVDKSDNVRFVNCTFAANRAGFGPFFPAAEGNDKGGGAFALGAVEDRTNRQSTLENCILWDNLAPTDRGSQIALVGEFGGTLSVSDCDVQTWDTDDGVFVDVGTLNWLSGNFGELSSHAPQFFADPSTGPDNDWGTPDDDYGDLRVKRISPCLDVGDDAAIPDDLTDVDNDADSGEPTPDLSLDDRIACVIEIGAYEHNESCPGDADEDGLIDIDDLAAVVLQWGNCPAWPAPCSADFELDPCRNGLVDINDLTAVILNWGSCSAQSSTYSPNSNSHFSFITTDRDSPPPPPHPTAASESSDDSSPGNSSSNDSLSSSEAILQLLADGIMSPDQFTELVNAGLFP